MSRLMSLWITLCTLPPLTVVEAQRRGTPVRVSDTAGVVRVGTVDALDSTLLALIVLDTSSVTRVVIPRAAIAEVEILDGPVLDRRVRVRHSCRGSLPGFPEELKGTVQGLTSDTLMLMQQAGAPVPVRLVCLKSLGIYRSRGSAAGTGALLGLLSGAALGAGIAALSVATNDCTGDLCGLEYLAFVYLPPLGAVTGLLFGAVIGAGQSVERWHEVPLDALRPKIVPAVGGVRIGARIAF